MEWEVEDLACDFHKGAVVILQVWEEETETNSHHFWVEVAREEEEDPCVVTWVP